MNTGVAFIRASVLPIVLAVLILSTSSNAAAGAAAAPTRQKKLKSDAIRLPVFEKNSDPHSSTLSPDAVQLADMLQLSGRFTQLKQLQEQARQQTVDGRAPVELRQDISDLKVEIIEIIEQTRLEIDFASSEIEEEQASVEEVLKWYVNERDDRVAKANLWAFRTNGVLWAAAEGFAIPTYKHPKYAIPSGAVGIVAGLVPSLFSLVAVRSVGGKHHERKAYPNMLSKLYDLPTSPRTEYPESVWKHLNAPCGDGKLSRREMLMDHWVHSQNIYTLRHGLSKETLERITGIDQSDISIELLNDRASMLRELKACVMQMTRPLMELSMCLRDRKQVAARVIAPSESP